MGDVEFPIHHKIHPKFSQETHFYESDKHHVHSQRHTEELEKGKYKVYM